MTRKFRMYVRKHQYRRRVRETLIVSIPLSLVTLLSTRPTALRHKQCSPECTQPAQPLHEPMMHEPLLEQPVESSVIVSLPLSYFSALPLASLSELHSRMVHLNTLPNGWSDTTSSAEQITLCRIVCPLTAALPNIDFTLTIEADFTWKLYFYNQRLEIDCCPTLASTSPVVKSPANLVNLISVIESSQVCIGNPDEKFLPLLKRYQGLQEGVKSVAKHDTNSESTIRHSNCQILVPSNSLRCLPCQKCRTLLRSQLIKLHKAEVHSEARTDPHSHTNFKSLTKKELVSRAQQLSSLQASTNRKLVNIKAKLNAAIESNGHIVDDETHSDLIKMVEQHSSEVTSHHPQGSFPRVFWEQQIEAARQKDSRGMRWHPLLIKWAIYLHYRSSGAYETLRSSGVIKLPSQRSLRDYTHHFQAKVGFSEEVEQQLMSHPDVCNAEEWQKYVILLLDEMHIREDLIYNKHTGALIGFANLGDITNHLEQFERSLETTESQQICQPLAKTMFVIMVRGLLTKLRFPYAQFTSVSLTGEHICPLFWEAVYRVERCELKVIGATFDGASPNRRFLTLHGPASKGSVLHKVKNPYTVEKREIFFFSDPPHLMKTVRNCWSSRARQLWNNGKPILWKHLQDLYAGGSGATKEAPGLSIVPKLKYEHIFLTSFSKMRVDLAVQVLSNSVATALRLTGGEDVEETAKFVEYFDKFFDCLNVGDFTSGMHSRNSFKSPYYSGKDFRLKWLSENFLKFLDDWEKSIEKRQGFTKKEKNLMLLSAETRLGLRITVKSFVELTRYLFKVPGVKVFLSRRLSQDPLEQFFGCQRQRGGVHDNPNAVEFLKNSQVLRVVNSFCTKVGKGNCRGSMTEAMDLEKESQPLPRRKKKNLSTNQ